MLYKRAEGRCFTEEEAAEAAAREGEHEHPEEELGGQPDTLNLIVND